MSLRTALDRIIVIQAAVSITDPVTTSIKRAYKLSPDQSEELADLPCVMNNVFYVGQEASAQMRTLRYRVQMQCMVAKSGIEDDRSGDIAVALWEKLLDDFSRDIMLAGTVTLALFEEGSSPMPALLDRGTKYIGFEATLNIQITEAFAFA